MKLSASIAVFCAVLTAAKCRRSDGSSLFSRLRYGTELVRRLLDPSSGAGQFFGSILKREQRDKTDSDDGRVVNDLFMTIVRSVVGDENDVGAAVVQVSILLAKMISDATDQGERRSRRRRDEGFAEPLSAFLRLPQVESLMSAARDPELGETVLRQMNLRQHPSGSNECVKLLVCKVTPFVRGMQRSVDFFFRPRGSVDGACFDEGGTNPSTGGETRSMCGEAESWASAKPTERLYLFLPDRREFLENGDACDDRHPLCSY